MRCNPERSQTALRVLCCDGKDVPYRVGATKDVRDKTVVAVPAVVADPECDDGQPGKGSRALNRRILRESKGARQHAPSSVHNSGRGYIDTRLRLSEDTRSISLLNGSKPDS
ncbi:hypothetical protein GCM10027191_16530 [Novilysobacter erysipheiresistens]